MTILLARSVGIFVAGMGVLILVRPETARKLLSFFAEGNRIYWNAALRLFFGLVLLLATRHSRNAGVVLTLAVIFLISGVLIIVLGAQRMKPLLEWWQGLPSYIFRILAGLMVFLATMILYAA